MATNPIYIHAKNTDGPISENQVILQNGSGLATNGTEGIKILETDQTTYAVGATGTSGYDHDYIGEIYVPENYRVVVANATDNFATYQRTSERAAIFGQNDSADFEDGGFVITAASSGATVKVQNPAGEYIAGDASTFATLTAASLPLYIPEGGSLTVANTSGKFVSGFYAGAY